MVDIRDFQYMPLRVMKKWFNEQNDVTVDINKIGETLEVSVLPHDLSKYRIGNEKVMCAFVTNDEGNSCIFYNQELYGDKERADRVFIMQAFAKYIATCQKEFLITEKTEFSQWEKTLVAEMLMPREAVKDVISKLIIPTTYSLSEVFQVPQSFVKERLKFTTTSPNMRNSEKIFSQERIPATIISKIQITVAALLWLFILFRIPRQTQTNAESKLSTTAVIAPIRK